MQTSTRLLALISAQQTLLINKDNQTERLRAELKRLQEGKPPYHIAVLVKTALKLIDVADKGGNHISDLLHHSYEKTQEHQKWELVAHKSESEELRLRDAHRKELGRIIAAGHMQNLHTALANRANENLCRAQLLIVEADGNRSRLNYLPTGDDLAGLLATLKNLTMSFAHNMAEQGETIAKYDQVQNDDGFEVRTQKEALQVIQAFANGYMETAIALVDTGIASLKSINTLSEAHKKERIEWVAAYGVASGSLAKFACDILKDTMAAIGTVTVQARVTTSKITTSDLYKDLAALTSKNANVHLN